MNKKVLFISIIILIIAIITLLAFKLTKKDNLTEGLGTEETSEITSTQTETTTTELITEKTEPITDQSKEEKTTQVTTSKVAETTTKPVATTTKETVKPSSTTTGKTTVASTSKTTTTTSKTTIKPTTTSKSTTKTTTTTKKVTTTPKTTTTTKKTTTTVSYKTVEEKETQTLYGTVTTKTYQVRYKVYPEGKQEKITSSLMNIDVDYSGYTGNAGVLRSEASKLSNSNLSKYKEILNLTNEYRKEKDVEPLTLDNNLSLAATLRAMEIALSNTFSHYRPDGTTFDTVIDELNIHTGYSLGENIAKGQSSPSAVCLDWKNSSGHYKNMTNKTYTKLGVGYYAFNGKNFWVQIFSD